MRHFEKTLSLALLLALPAALAYGQGVISLPKTGQTSCWTDTGASTSCTGTGQDGDIQAGEAWPSPRVVFSGLCYTDQLTGLMWTTDGTFFDSPSSWASAVTYANDYSLCGHSDWRLPNANEIISQANAQGSTTTWLQAQGILLPPANGISSTTVPGSSSNFFVTEFNNQPLNVNAKSPISFIKAVPVRGGQQNSPDATYPANLAKTGQTASYETGDDGDLEWGVPWPSPRFTDNGNQTVTDNLTGLVWTKAANTPGPATCSPGVTKKWQNLLDHAQCLNTNNYLGSTGWRLPNRVEMRSLIDFSNSNPALPTGHPFTDVQPVYVTSTTIPSTTNRSAWRVSLFSGSQAVGGYAKDIHNVWAWFVRDDTGVPPCTDLDGDGYGNPGSASCSNGSANDCNDGDPAINPGAAELCDGLDNDCNGSTDEGFGIGNACSVGQGECLANGLRICSGDGSTWVCDATPGTPQAETCDGLDNDCNGTVDDGNPGGGGACSTGQPGICDAGTLMCTGGALVCEPDASAVPETCNGLDDNCDGSTDEGFGIGSACSVGQGECLANGFRICSGDGSTWACDATPGTPQAEVCDGLDNDCDGTVDDGNPGGGGSCSTGLPGICDAGTWTCTGGGLACQQDTSAGSETCNGLDDDCDGSVDEDAIDATTWYRDGDGDGYGDANDSLVSCTQPPGYVADDQDCDDGDAGIGLCNTPESQTPVVVTDPSGNASVEFPDVTTGGHTTVGEVSCTMNQPDGFTLNTSATCYQIETTADSSTGEKIVCIRYSDSLSPLPTYLFKCESAGMQNCCAIPLAGGPTTCPPGTLTPFPAFQSQSVVPPDQLEICVSTYYLSDFGFGELEDSTDSDFDSVPDVVDNCPLTFNPLQEDADYDGKGDVCDPPQVDDTGASDVFVTPSCYPGCDPADFPKDWGVLHTFVFSLPLDEEVGEVVISGTWGDVDNFDSSAPAEIYLDGILVAECLEFDLCWQDDGQFVDWSFSFLTAGVPNLEGLFRDGEAELTAIQNGEISLILSNLRLQIYTRPVSVPTSLPISPVVWVVVAGLFATLGFLTLLRTREYRGSPSPSGSS